MEDANSFIEWAVSRAKRNLKRPAILTPRRMRAKRSQPEINAKINWILPTTIGRS